MIGQYVICAVAGPQQVTTVAAQGKRKQDALAAGEAAVEA